MRMDLVKPRYETFDELYEYCYKVAGTVGLMTTPVMGVDPSYKVGRIYAPGLCCCGQQVLRMKQCPQAYMLQTKHQSSALGSGRVALKSFSKSL